MWRLGALVAAPLAVGIGFAITTGVADAATAAGTAITNTATASYSDGTNTYTSQSNTVTTTVQNAPAETVTPTAGTGTVSNGQTVTDTFTLTNTGNGTGDFQLTGALGTNDGVDGGTGAATFQSFLINGTTYTTVASANTALAALPIAALGTLTIGVTYTAGAADTSGQTIITQVTPTLTYAAGSGTTAQTTASQVGQETDTVTTDARVDVQKTASVGGTVAAPVVTYAVRFANGGSRVIQPVDTGSLPTGVPQGCTAGANPCGIFFSDKIPSYNAVQLTLNGTPTVSGTTGTTLLYSTNGTSWTTTITGAVYVGVFVPAAQLTGASLATFQANNNASSTNNVTAAQAALTLNFAINGSTATGAGNATAITNIANSVYADNAGYIEGAGVTPLTNLNNGSSTTTANSTVTNTSTPTSGSGYIASPADPTSGAVLNGPNGFPAAVGPTNNNDDYTSLSYNNGGSASLLQSTNGQTETVPSGAAAIVFTNSVQNTGNKFDTYTLTASTATGDSALPTGFNTVSFVSTGQTATANCPAVTAGTVITTICVESGATANYSVKYTSTAASTFTNYAQYGDFITATSANTPASNNITTDEFIVGGYVKLSKVFTVAPGIPCTTATAGQFVTQTTALPGDCVQYTVTYFNAMPTGGTNNSTLAASNVVVTEDGTGSGTTNGIAYTNNWATFSNGLYAAPVDSNGGTFVYSPTPGTAAASTKFTDTIATLAAGATGTVSFKVQVK